MVRPRALSAILTACPFLVARTAPAEPAAPNPGELSAQSARVADANVDHVVIMPTAETHPGGTFFFTDYEILTLNFGYALTDHFELELTAFVPFGLDAAMKVNFLRLPHFRGAGVAALDTFIGDFRPIFRAGLAGQLCFSAACSSSVTLNAFGGISRSDLLDPRRYVVGGSGGAIIALSPLVKLLLEPIVVWSPTDQGGIEVPVSVGLRLSREHWGLDLCVISVPNSGDVPPVVPWLAFTLRSVPKN